MTNINPMCLNCTKFGVDCKGEKNMAYAGCIFKTSKQTEVLKENNKEAALAYLIAKSA